jgi:hypothetical protein
VAALMAQGVKVYLLSGGFAGIGRSLPGSGHDK